MKNIMINSAIIKGKWNGSYWFSGNVPDSLKDRETDFELIIEEYSNSKISGKISDNVEMGGTKGIGNFSGTIKGNEIRFVKRMPVSTLILPNGTRVEEDKPHSPIYYKGIIDSQTGSVKGTWKLKIRVGFVQGRLAFFPGTKGQWEMNKS